MAKSCVCAKFLRSCLTFCHPMDSNPPGFSVHWILQASILERVAISLLQDIFPTQESNLGLLHRRQIFYHVSYQGSQKRGKTLQSQGLRDIHPHLFWDKRGITHTQAACGSKIRGQCQAIISTAPPRSLHFKIHLGSGVSLHSGKALGQIRHGERNQISGLKEDKNLEEVTYVNNLTTSDLMPRLIRGDAHTLPLQVCISALLLS